LNTSAASEAGRQFAFVAEGGRGLLLHRNVSSASMEALAVHPSTVKAMQVAIQSAHENAPASHFSDTGFAKKLSWKTSGIGRRYNNYSGKDQQNFDDIDSEKEEGFLPVKDCVTDIIESYAKE
jgi:hypothetical protein